MRYLVVLYFFVFYCQAKSLGDVANRYAGTFGFKHRCCVHLSIDTIDSYNIAVNCDCDELIITVYDCGTDSAVPIYFTVKCLGDSTYRYLCTTIHINEWLYIRELYYFAVNCKR